MHVDKCRNAAIRIVDKDLTTDRKGRGAGCCWVHTMNTQVCSVYVSPNSTQEEYDNFLVELTRTIRQAQLTRLIVGGDFNAKASHWGSKNTDWKGHKVLEWAASMDLICANAGDQPTFEGAAGSSHIDLTFISPAIAGQDPSWRILNDETLSDHRCIQLELRPAARQPRVDSKQIGWLYETPRPGTVGALLRTYIDDKLLNTNTLTEATTRTCNTLLRPKLSGGKTRGEHWWTPQVSQAHQICVGYRRRMTRRRERERARCPVLQEEFQAARAKLRAEIRCAKQAAWNDLCNMLNENPWGRAYQIVTRGAGIKAPTLDWITTQGVISKLFPTGTGSKRRRAMSRTFHVQNLFTEAEVRAAAQRMKPGRAGGPDGIPPEIVKLAAAEWTTNLCEVMNTCLRAGVFPKKWKIGRLVLLPKPGKPGTYRPLCLLDTFGKLLERMILARLNEHLDEVGAISEGQYGFRQGKSTIDACKVVDSFAGESNGADLLMLLDAKNAFNSAPWDITLDRLAELKTPPDLMAILTSYLSDRRLLVTTKEGTRKVRVSCGVPQGSILGPTLWNVLYDGVLRVRLPRECTPLAYADDLAVLIKAGTIPLAKMRAEDAYGRINQWTNRHGIALEPTKTEAMIVRGRKRPPEITLDLGGHSCTTTKAAKYLGVWVATNKGYATHAKQAAEKAVKKVDTIRGIMANTKGPTEKIRRVICTAARAALRYGAELWGPRLTQTSWGLITSAERKMALRCIAGYRTVSAAAAEVLASATPTRHLYGPTDAYQAWQTEWSSSDKGRWTRRLIPTLRTWTERGHGETNYYLTQLLTGHGDFGQYLTRFKIKEDDTCTLCGEDVDSVEHTFYECPATRGMRRKAEAITGGLTPDNTVAAMLKGEAEWAAVSSWAKEVMEAKA